MSATWRYLNKDKGLIQEVSGICFAPIAYGIPKDSAFIQYLPIKSGNLAKKDYFFIDCLKQLWHFKEMLDGQSSEDILSKGAILDLKHHATAVVLTLMALRYIDEAQPVVERIWKLHTDYPDLSAFHLFLAAETLVGGDVNLNHRIICPPYRNVLDFKMVIPEFPKVPTTVSSKYNGQTIGREFIRYHLVPQLKYGPSYGWETPPIGEVLCSKKKSGV